MFRKKRDKKKALKIVCPKCCGTISDEIVSKAGEKARRKLEESVKKYGTMSMKNEWEIVCGGCGQKITYNPYDGNVKEK